MQFSVICSISVPCTIAIITRHPNDVYTYPGRTAKFPCVSNATTRIPEWNISGVIYHTRNLPQQFKYFNKQLIYSNVSTSSNGTTFQCVFLAQREQSEIAKLIIIPG